MLVIMTRIVCNYPYFGCPTNINLEADYPTFVNCYHTHSIPPDNAGDVDTTGEKHWALYWASSIILAVRRHTLAHVPFLELHRSQIPPEHNNKVYNFIGFRLTHIKGHKMVDEPHCCFNNQPFFKSTLNKYANSRTFYFYRCYWPALRSFNAA